MSSSTPGRNYGRTPKKTPSRKQRLPSKDQDPVEVLRLRNVEFSRDVFRFVCDLNDHFGIRPVLILFSRSHLLKEGACRNCSYGYGMLCLHQDVPKCFIFGLARK